MRIGIAKGSAMAALAAWALAACQPEQPPPAKPEPAAEARTAAPEEAPAEAPVETGEPRADTGEAMALEGMFRVEAGLPLFRDCASGRTVRVATSGPFMELEKAYLNSGIESGKELGVALEGRYLEGQTDGEKQSEIVLLVDKFNTLLEAPECVPAAAVEPR